MLRPQRLCRHHDQERGGRGLPFPEGLLFKHFPRRRPRCTPRILAEECEADPDFAHLLGQEPSTATLVELMQGHGRPLHAAARRAGSGRGAADAADGDEPSRRRRVRAAALRQGRRADRPDCSPPRSSARSPPARRRRSATSRSTCSGLRITPCLMGALTQFPATPCLPYGDAAAAERQLCQFILRGIGLTEAAISTHLGREPSPSAGPSVTAESA